MINCCPLPHLTLTFGEDTLETPNVIIFDAFSVLANEDGNTWPEYAYDLLHLNTTGYEMLNHELVQVLATLK